MKPESQEPTQPNIRIVAADPICGGRYAVRCSCGRVWDAWVDAVPYVECPGCGVRVMCDVIRAWKKHERWAT